MRWAYTAGVSTPPQPWTPEVEVSLDRAKLLISKRFPERSGARIEPLARGWDNVAYRVDERLVFRFPQRRVGVPLIEVEVALLPWLAARLPFGVTAPTHVARPTGGYAFPFAGYPEMVGRPPAARGSISRPGARWPSRWGAGWARCTGSIRRRPPPPERRPTSKARRTFTASWGWAAAG